jgi:hypothetical protein
MAGLAQWTGEFLKHQGRESVPVCLGQDNKATITLVTKGHSTSDRTRHVAIRYYWVHDLIARNQASVVYVPTHDMVADILTKPLQGVQFARLRDILLGDAMIPAI